MRRTALIGTAAMLLSAGLGTAVFVTAGETQSNLAATCRTSVNEALLSGRIVNQRQSYASDSRIEAPKVFAYLRGGVRPTGVTTHMGEHLVALEDVCRELEAPPTTTTTTTTEPPTTTTTTEPPPTTTEPPSADILPGQSWNTAYQGASCGQVFQLGVGAHGTQVLRENVTLSACSENVVFRGAPGVTMTNLSIGSINTATLDGADRVTVEGPLAVLGGVSCMGDCHNIVIDGIDGGTITLDTFGGSAPNVPTNWLIRNSDFGPCPSSGPQQQAGVCRTVAPDSGQIELIGVQNISFVGNTIHDYELVTQGDHFECVRTSSGSNYVWRGNKFWGCEIYALSTTNWGGVNYIENNWFGGSDGPSGNAVGEAITADPTVPGTIYVRFNSFSSLDAITSDIGFDHVRWHIIGNLIGRSPLLPNQCFTNAVYRYNIFVSNPCGDSTNVGNVSLQYVNGTRGSSMNYHLAPAAWLADNFVPASAANSDVQVDFDGQPRTAPRDAGSDER